MLLSDTEHRNCAYRVNNSADYMGTDLVLLRVRITTVIVVLTSYLSSDFVSPPESDVSGSWFKPSSY